MTDFSAHGPAALQRGGGVIEIGDVVLTAAPRRERARGLLGWISATFEGQLRVDGIAVRRTQQGGLTLSYPCRNDRHGRRHFVFRPVDDVARRDLETAIFAALAAEVGA